MFIRNDEKKVTEPRVEPQPPAALAVAAATPAPAAPATPARKEVVTIISADLAIKGTLHTDRNVQIDGRIEGDIHTAGLLLCEQAMIIGNIYAQEAVVKGRVQGTIEARIVHLGKTAQVTGDIIHGGQLSMETGAYFEGSSRNKDRVMKKDDDRYSVAAE
jgi:cytoskeletal protein CcmA (bactofilin family)